MTKIELDGPVTIVPVHEPEPPQPADDTVWWCLLILALVAAFVWVGQ